MIVLLNPLLNPLPNQRLWAPVNRRDRSVLPSEPQQNPMGFGIWCGSLRGYSLTGSVMTSSVDVGDVGAASSTGIGGGGTVNPILPIAVVHCS